MLENNFKSLIREKRLLYKKIGGIYCPVLNVQVNFNAKGFNHLLRDGYGNTRNHIEAKDRLNLIHKSPGIIQRAASIDEYRLRGNTQFWALRETDIIVILKKIGNGNVCFWSIWKRD